MVVKRIFEITKNQAGIIISIAILIITLYSTFYSQPNANKITIDKLQHISYNLQQIANSTYVQKPFLVGDASCYFFTSNDVQKYNFSWNDSNNYYADVFQLRVKGASANNPRMRVSIRKDIQFAYMGTYPEEMARIKKGYDLENMNILVSWQEKVPL